MIERSKIFNGLFALFLFVACLFGLYFVIVGQEMKSAVIIFGCVITIKVLY